MSIEIGGATITLGDGLLTMILGAVCAAIFRAGQVVTALESMQASFAAHVEASDKAHKELTDKDAVFQSRLDSHEVRITALEGA